MSRKLVALLSALVVVSSVSADGVWSSGAYRYDGAGKITAIGNHTYGHDAVGRLTKAQIGGTPSALLEYEYDAYGNRIAHSVQQQRIVVPIDSASNRFIDAAYDAVGNQLARGSTAATYDGFGMMTSYRFDSVNAETFVYSPSDERIVYRGSLLLGSERAPSEGGRRHYHLDHLGSPRLVTGAAGSVISAHDYLPFGEERTPAGQQLAKGFDREHPQRFTGHERDFDTAAPTGTSASLDAMHARYYTAVTGRFLSVDPVLDIREALTEPQLWNRYTYVTNNPLKFTDPDGRYRTFYKEKAMTSENLRMDENTPIVVKGAFYVQGGLVGLVAGEAIAVAGGQGLLAAAGRKMFEWGVRATPLLNVLRKWGAGETGAPSLPFGISNKGLKHALKHLDQFQALDRSFDQNRMIALAAKIVADGDNLVGTPGGRTVYEQVVKVGDELVKVRVIVNPEGNLRSVHIRP